MHALILGKNNVSFHFLNHSGDGHIGSFILTIGATTYAFYYLDGELSFYNYSYPFSSSTIYIY